MPASSSSQREDIAPRWAPYVGVTDLRGILVRVWQERGQVLREPAEIDFAAAGANRVALIADPSGAALFLYQLDERAENDPTMLANTPRSAPPPAPRSSGGNPNVHMSVTVGYGFGPGWGGRVSRCPSANARPVLSDQCCGHFWQSRWL